MSASSARSRIAELALRHGDAHQLARLVSLAADIDSQLLRCLRLRLLPRSDASAEAELWFSDLVTARNSRGFALDADVAELLREELVSEGLLGQVWAILHERHPQAPPLVALEEELTFLALSKRPAQELEQKLGEVLLALAREPTRGRDLSAWARRSLPHLPSAVRDTRAAWLLALGASARLAVPTTLGGTPPAGVTELSLPGLMPSELGEVRLEVRRIAANQVELRESKTTTPGGSFVHVPNTRPRLVEVISGDAPAEVLTLEPGAARAITMTSNANVTQQLTLRALSGRQWRVGLHNAQEQHATSASSSPGVRWLHLSDPQIEQDLELQWQALRAELREIGFNGDLDLVLVSGDISHDGSAEQFATARSWVEALDRDAGAPRLVLAVPGNHDAQPAEHDKYGVTTLGEDDPFWTDPEHPLRRQMKDWFRPFAEWQDWLFHSRSMPSVQRGILPGDFSLSLELPIGRVGIVGINNVFGVNPTRRRIPLRAFAEQQFNALCGGDLAAWRERHELTLLVGHYPPRALQRTVRAWFNQRIAPHFDLIFAGATEGGGAHEQRESEAGRGLMLQVGPFQEGTQGHRLALGCATRSGSSTRVDVWSRRWDSERNTFAIDQREDSEEDPVTLKIERALPPA